MSRAASTPPALPQVRPPYRAALGVCAVVLAGYVATLAPSVTFWDAGEFIAAARILGIPHPPGTPLFVLLGNVWAQLLPFGEFAWRTNLMSATFSAAGAALFFLVVHQALRREDAPVRLGGAAAGALVSAFVFTVWQNSNETEVYMVATFSIAAICWLCLLWRGARGTSRAAHLLLLVVYLAAVSVGAHLMTLLVGPAVAVFLLYVIRTEPASDPRERTVELSDWAVLCALWGLLLGVGLGSRPLLALFGLAFLAALAFALVARNAGFAVVALVVAALGVSTYLFLYIRAGLHPLINEADPSNWHNLWDVIRREQYPPRSPFDDPTFLHGPDNPGRTPLLFVQQVANYLQYFDWQWARSIAAGVPAGLTGRLPFTLLFATLGVHGLTALRRQDRAVFWLLFTLWLVTGLGMVGYMNFKPGFSLFYHQYPDPMDQHEVRERDYFFVVSFQVWGLAAGVGVASLVRRLRAMMPWAAPAAFVLAAALPFALNFSAATRRHGPDALLARDFAYDLLQSVEPYGLVFTYGDNDTFPLWYAQEVDGVRQDVTVVNLSLAQTDWYLGQLRDNPVRPFDAEGAPAFYRRLAPATPPGPLHTLTDAQIAGLQAFLLDQDVVFRAGGIELPLERGRAIQVRDQVVLSLVAHNVGRRSVTFAVSAGMGVWTGLDRYLVLQGLVYRAVDRLALTVPGLEVRAFRVPIDVGRTDTLAWQVYRYARVFEVDSLRVEPTVQFVTGNLSLPFLLLGQAYALRGDSARTLQNLDRAYHLAPSAELRRFIADIRRGGLEAVLPRDTGQARQRR